MFDVFDRIRGILLNILCPENKERLQRNSLQVYVYGYTGMFAVTRQCATRHENLRDSAWYPWYLLLVVVPGTGTQHQPDSDHDICVSICGTIPSVLNLLIFPRASRGFCRARLVMYSTWYRCVIETVMEFL